MTCGSALLISSSSWIHTDLRLHPKACRELWWCEDGGVSAVCKLDLLSQVLTSFAVTKPLLVELPAILFKQPKKNPSYFILFF